MILLIALSILSLTVILERLFALRKKKIFINNFDDFLEHFDSLDSRAKIMEFIQKPQSLLEAIICGAIKDYINGDDKISLEKSLEVSAEHHMGYLSRGLWILNAVGNLAPLLGLLGTVVGLALAFKQIGLSGLSQESVAKGIYMALTTTITGLSIAIPTLFALYGIRALGDRHYNALKQYLNRFLAFEKQKLTPFKSINQIKKDFS
jgi:biopolymer transport protein ExbB